MCRKLFIIGNGFDLAHEVESSYSDFKNFLEENYTDTYDFVQTYCRPEMYEWQDFEDSLKYSALYNFYATSEVDETSLHKACTKSVGFFAVWALETKVPKNISCCICQLIWFCSSCGLAFQISLPSYHRHRGRPAHSVKL